MTGHVLITGGFGYIGGRIVASLQRDTDWKLRVTTRQNRVWPDEGPGQSVDVREVDFETCNNLDMACQGVQHIVHLAALNEIDSATDPERALIVNGLGTLRLLRVAEKAGVERFLYLSTAHVYGVPLAGIINENSLPCPVHPYAISHRTAEDCVLEVAARKGLKGIVLRLSNSVGNPVMPEVNRWTLLGNDLCRQAVTDRKLVLKSSGVQMRDFIPMSDVTSAVKFLLTSDDDTLHDGIFNLGGERAMTVYEFACLVSQRCGAMLGFVPEIIRPEQRAGENTEQLEYQIDRIKAAGFRLSGSLEDEIDETLRFCQRVYGK